MLPNVSTHSDPQMSIPEGIEAPTVLVQPIAAQQIAFQPVSEYDANNQNLLVTQSINLGNKIIKAPCDKECQGLPTRPGPTIAMLPEFQGNSCTLGLICLFDEM